MGRKKVGGKEKKKKIHRNDTATRPKQHFKIQYLTEFLALDCALVGSVQQRCGGDVGGISKFLCETFPRHVMSVRREAQKLNPFNKSSTHPYESRCQPVSRCVYLRWYSKKHMSWIYILNCHRIAYLHFFCVFMTVSLRWLWHRLIDRLMCVEHGVPGQSQFSPSWVTQIHFNFVHLSHC